MKSYNIIVFILIFIFFIMFFILLYFSQNKIIKYRVTKEPIDKNINIIDTDKIKNIYKITECGQICKPELCDDYLNQKIKYDLCKECKKKMMCYDEGNGCIPCINFESCENKYGCENTKPLNPLNNYCTKCW